MIQKENAIPKLDYISGACLFTHTSNLRKIGLLPEKYFLYWEETDWCYLARQSGCQFYVCHTAICYDKISTVIGKSFMADYYYMRNGLLFISKYRSKNIPFVIFFAGIRFMKRVITGQWKRANGVLKGMRDFLK
jgi:GT2 family glycosyltransferase